MNKSTKPEVVKQVERLERRAIERLTLWEPGFGNLWPARVELFEFVRRIDGRHSEWKNIKTIQYAALSSEQHAWRKRKKIST